MKNEKMDKIEMDFYDYLEKHESDIFQHIDEEKLEEMIDSGDYNPITICCYDGIKIDVVTMMRTISATGMTYIMCFDIEKKMHQVPENYIVDIVYHEPKEYDFIQYNKLVDEAKSSTNMQRKMLEDKSKAKQYV